MRTSLWRTSPGRTFETRSSLGKARDPSAWVALQRRYVPTGEPYNIDKEVPAKDLFRGFYGLKDEVTETRVDVAYHYEVLDVQRLPLGMGYDEQITQAVSYVQAVMVQLADGPMIVADKTGVGDAIIDTLRSALKDAGLSGDVGVVPIFIKGAGSFTRNGRFGFNVSIEDIIHNAAILMQRGQIKFSAGIPLIQTALNELKTFTIKKNRRNPDQDRYEAWGEGDHDDIVFALALPLWLAETFYGYPKYAELKGHVLADSPVNERIRA